MRGIVFAALLLVYPSFVAAQSVAKAKLMHVNRLFDDAKREAVAVVFSDASSADKADALNLLGTIAVEQSDYEAAVKNWTELINKYPETMAAKEAQAKLPLAERLITNAAVAKDRVAIDGVGAVVIAGVAPEHPQYADQAVLEFMNFLTSRGVKTTNLFSERVGDATQGRIADVSVPNLLARARDMGATSVLYVYIHFRGMENMRVECYASNGKKLWQEKAAASLGASPAGMTEGFVRRMKGKLAKHVGGPCFPVATAPGS
jgi:hypothetical protein